MKFLEKINMDKKTAAIVVGGMVVGLIIGFGAGASATPVCSEEKHDGIDKKVIVLENLVEDKDKKIKELDAKVTQARPWFDMNEEEQKKIEEENARIEAERRAKEEEEKRIAEEEAAKKAEEARVAKEKQAEEERIAKENAEKNKYETNITYSQVARNPDDYISQLGKFKGKVVQVIEGNTHNNLRVAVGGNYDNMLLVEYDPSILSQRILENDQVTIYGANMGIYSYESTLGATISIPSMLAHKIDIH